MSNAIAPAATTTEAAKPKKNRSPAITWKMMIEVINILRFMDPGDDGIYHEKPEGEDANSVTTHDIAKWFNSHKYDPTKDCTEWELSETPGVRPSTSIYQWLVGKRKDLDDMKSKITAESYAYLEDTLDAVDTSEAKELDLDSIVGGIKSLGLFRVPAHMVAKSGYVGTSGQPVGTITLDDDVRLKPE